LRTNALPACDTKLQRSRGSVRLSFRRRETKTVLDRLYQQGCCKARFPGPNARPIPEAVLINTSGGLTDGDELSTAVDWQAGTAALITTQAAESIYKSRASAAIVRTKMTVGEGATACWLPRETILFDGGRLDRATDVELSSGSRLLAAEVVVFGRTAMGEALRSGGLSERWRIRLNGRLIFADTVQIDDTSHGDPATRLARPCIADGAACMATLVYVGEDCHRYLDAVRHALHGSDVTAGASDLGPLIVARLLAKNGQGARAAVARVFESLRARDDAAETGHPFALPRVWTC
jgi:urease accessory protein